MNFDLLVQSIADVHREMQARAVKAVNVGLTLRNWLIGAYISEYELRGEDRAAYGEKLIVNLAKSLKTRGIVACEQQRLSGYRLVYRAFPQIWESVTPELESLLPNALRTTGAEPLGEIHRTLSGESPADTAIVEAPSPQSTVEPIHRTASGKLQTPGRILLERLSYSHLELLAPVAHPLKRTFYEIECIKGGWSVRELKRQIGALYFERSGLSKDPEALARLAHDAAETQTTAHLIRDPFIFDFLGIPAGEALTESVLEDALMRHLQRFLLELGRGFCFEARQKRMLIGGEHFFCDLVFYHRILKCHVLVELKVDHFRHEHLGQLNSYLGWFRENEMQPGDQPPVGILLCTEQNSELVRYALAGLDQQLFVSRYQLELPATAEIEAFLKRELEQWKESRE
jgi:predicted nuclease of restriction endonuclease-like (RecB) superfamily